jgi:large subunit ribosomal protein L22
MRLVADIVRGKNIEEALNILTFSSKHASQTIEKLLRSAIANWEQKFGTAAAESDLYIESITIDGGRVLKRFQPAPQGRAHRIRKRSNHITIILDSGNFNYGKAAAEGDVEDADYEDNTIELNQENK